MIAEEMETMLWSLEPTKGLLIAEWGPKSYKLRVVSSLAHCLYLNTTSTWVRQNQPTQDMQSVRRDCYAISASEGKAIASKSWLRRVEKTTIGRTEQKVHYEICNVITRKHNDVVFCYD